MNDEFPLFRSENELEPWVIIINTGESTELAVWQLESGERQALALFATRELALQYAEDNITADFELRQLRTMELLRVLTDCFRQQIEFAALNPSGQEARQVFVVREVLKAAKQQLSAHRDSLS